MGMKKLKTDDEFRHLIRPLRGREYAQLEQNILADGCRDPIVVWNDVIVDGHNRYEICVRHGISFETKDMEFECREAAIAWICANQLGRRNITEETRKFLIGMQYENEKVVTRIRNKIGRNQHSMEAEPVNDEAEDVACRHRTAQRIAEENNVSAATVQKYAIFTRALEEIGKKEPKLVPKILSGQYKIAHKHVMEMAELPVTDLRRINRKIDRNPAQFIQYKSTLQNTEEFHQISVIVIDDLSLRRFLPQENLCTSHACLYICFVGWHECVDCRIDTAFTSCPRQWTN